jgi:hypothetical protein
MARRVLLIAVVVVVGLTACQSGGAERNDTYSPTALQHELDKEWHTCVGLVKRNIQLQHDLSVAKDAIVEHYSFRYAKQFSGSLSLWLDATGQPSLSQQVTETCGGVPLTDPGRHPTNVGVEASRVSSFGCFQLAQHAHDPSPSIRLNRQEVDDVGPILTVLIAIAHQA